MSLNRRQFVAASAGSALALTSFTRRARAQSGTLRIGVVPFISSGPFFIAMAKGYFDAVDIKVEPQTFMDGALAVPALVAGELDATVATINAGLINAVSKGANYKLVLDRGSEMVGLGSMTIVASNKMYEAGLTSIDKFDMLEGAKFTIQAPGGIDQYLLARGLQNAGLDPTKAAFRAGLTYPDIVKSLGTGLTDVAQIPVPLAFLAEKNEVGKIIGAGYEIDPGAQLGCFAMPEAFLDEDRETAVRYAMAHIQAAREFVAAAESKDPEVIAIISEATKVPAPLVERAAPRWTGYDKDGMPNVKSCMDQAAFWVDTMKLISGPVPTEEALFDLSVAEEAAARLAKENPFL
ncbi:hypothetical protein DLJ53_12490 [Acuticoccus sediminis]|uniref:NitT/TauT family transport system substrate-binding protein n=1 Tax=Acuticoccus sediminis TaxID=2184697 RepID=A0A8B2NV43_9HYPH|nr:ABC transporter substrate-binding protein [Acuticoccus sediminis]RAI02178.1 hypothetical protein DLJ53_12490 [Acuticoccus sediminis]